MCHRSRGHGCCSAAFTPASHTERKTVLRRGPVTDHLLNTLYLCTEEVIISKAMIYH
jgi:hypothetical protein